MAMTHDDRDARDAIDAKESEFLTELERRANEMQENRYSEITAGRKDEPELAKWNACGMQVVVRPDDPQGILRISVGGGTKTPVLLNYCTIRGEASACIALLEQSIRALKAAP